MIISSVGYSEERIPLTPRTKMPIRVKLKPVDYNLKAVTIKPKKEKYRKKYNPAVILARNIIDRRNDNSPKNKPFYSRDRHEKLNVALNNFSADKSNHFREQFKFLEEYIDTSLISGKPILSQHNP